MTEFEPIDWVEFDDDMDDNEERAKNIIQKYRFDFDKIPKPEIVDLIKKEIENYAVRNKLSMVLDKKERGVLYVDNFSDISTLILEKVKKNYKKE